MELERSVLNECGLKEKAYMDDTHVDYFKNKLIGLKINIIEKIHMNKEKIKTMRTVSADILDQSNSMVAIEHEIQSQKRYHQKLQQIDAALHRIEDGSFGYCKITGIPIGLQRLEALPYTAVSMEALKDIDTWQ